MNNQNQNASEVKNSNLTSTLAHETRKRNFLAGLFLCLIAVVFAMSFSSCSILDNENSDLQNLLLIFVGVIIIAIWAEWQLGKAIGKRLSKSAGTIFGIVLILLGFSIIIGIAIIAYSGYDDYE